MKSSEERYVNPNELKRYRIPPPSPDLKERVLSAARAAWAVTEPAPADVPWGFPVLRLAACLTVAAGIMYLVNTASELSASRQIASEFSRGLMFEQSICASDIMASHIVAAELRVPPENALRDLLARQRRIQEMLETHAEQNG